MKALYICSERDSWKNTISFFKEFLEEVELFCSRDGSDGMDIIIHESPISVIIIDNILDENEDALSLANSFIDSTGQIPIIFLDDTEKIQDLMTSEFFALFKTNAVLEKPYDYGDMKQLVLKAISWSSNKEGGDAHQTDANAEYVPIKLKSFFLHEKVAYDVYCELYSGNYMKVITANKRYTESTIINLSKKNIKDLYLTKTEKIKFLEDSMEKAIEILSFNSEDNHRIITTQICGTLLIHEMINHVGVSSSVIELTDLIISKSSFIVKQYKNFNMLAMDIPITYGDLGEQAIYLLYLCHYLTKTLEWESDLTHKKLGLACLIHDCKIQHDDLSLVRNEQDEALRKFNLDSFKIFKEHCENAADVSPQFTNFPDCAFIIREHHTLPENKYTRSMNSISLLFNVARRLTTELSIVGFTKMGMKQALIGLDDYNSGNFKKSYDALLKVLAEGSK